MIDYDTDHEAINSLKQTLELAGSAHKVQLAAKAFTCENCLREIPRGKRYIRVFSGYVALHLDCLPYEHLPMVGQEEP
jgi:hypothetical protein